MDFQHIPLQVYTLQRQLSIPGVSDINTGFLALEKHLQTAATASTTLVELLATERANLTAISTKLDNLRIDVERLTQEQNTINAKVQALRDSRVTLAESGYVDMVERLDAQIQAENEKIDEIKRRSDETTELITQQEAERSTVIKNVVEVEGRLSAAQSALEKVQRDTKQAIRERWEVVRRCRSCWWDYEDEESKYMIELSRFA